jgi:hypothetical protein
VRFPSMTAISLRLPVALLECIKVAASKRDVFYQSLIKTWVAEKNKNRPEQVRLISRSSALAVSATLMSERQESARDQSRSGIGPPRGRRPITEAVIVIGLGFLIGIIAVLILHLML